MNIPAVLLPLAAVASACAGLAFMGLQLRKARLIEDTPTSRIRSAPQGYVELAGFARSDGDTPLRAPLTQEPCVWFKYRIERYNRNGEGSRWEIVESGTSENWFELDDDSGRCFVDPRGAEVTPTARERWQGSSRQAVGGRRHLSPLDLLFGGRFGFGGDQYRYTEWRIHAGTWLYALGQFETTHGPSSAEREKDHTRALLNQWKQNRDELLGRFDRNGDGEIDLQEWEEARRSAARAAQAQVLREPPAPAISVLCRPPDRRPYLIATTDPERLARRHRWQAALGLLIGGGLCALIVLHYLPRI